MVCGVGREIIGQCSKFVRVRYIHTKTLEKVINPYLPSPPRGYGLNIIQTGVSNRDVQTV